MLKKLSIAFSFALLLTIFPTGVYFLTYSKGVATNNDKKIIYELPYPGMLPDNPLYFLKNTRDRILELTTRENLKKAHLYLLFSDKKTAMALNLVQKGKEQLAVKTLSMAEEDFLKLKEMITTAKKQGVSADIGFKSQIKLSNQKHKEIIESMLKELSKDQTDSLNQILKLNEQISKELLK